MAPSFSGMVAHETNGEPRNRQPRENLDGPLRVSPPAPLLARSMRAPPGGRSAAVQQVAGGQVTAELGGVAEQHRVQADGAGGSHVGGRVVHEDGRRRGEAEAVEQQLEDAPVRLGQPLLAGDDQTVEPGQEREALPGQGEGLGRPVAQRVHRDAGGTQLGQQRHRPRDVAAEHLPPALVVGGDGRRLGGVACGQLGDRAGERTAAVLLGVPLRGGDGGQELLHRRLVAEQLAVQVAGVPVDQHPAKVEHDRLARHRALVLLLGWVPAVRPYRYLIGRGRDCRARVHKRSGPAARPGSDGSSGMAGDGRRRAWLVAAVVVALLLVGGGAYALLSLRTSDSPAPAALDEPVQTSPGSTATSGQAAAADSADGSWQISGDGSSFVGYRVREQLAFVSSPSDAVGRSTAVTGTMQVAGDQVEAVRVEADLTRLGSDEARRDNAIRQNGLQSNQFPTATFELTEPIRLDQAPADGQQVTGKGKGRLTAHGVTHEVTVDLRGRWDGDTIQVAGQLPIRMTDYGIQPLQIGPVVSIEDGMTVEFRLRFERA